MPDLSRKVAAIQMVTGPEVSANLTEAGRLLRHAAEQGAGLVVLPENFAFMGKRQEDLVPLREREGEGPLQTFLSETAARHGVWIVGGTIPLRGSDPGRVRAACLVFNDRGERVARYDKIHLFDVDVPGTDERYEESASIEPGGDVVLVDTPFGRLGLAVCYDLRFPELFRQMLDTGVELLAVPAAFTAITGRAHWETLLRARAIENLVYVVAAAQGGYHANGRETYGHSLIVDPWGKVVAERPQGAGFICCDLDPEYQRRVRLHFPAIAHRRLKCQ